MSLKILTIAVVFCMAAHASTSDEWFENTATNPLVKPIESEPGSYKITQAGSYTVKNDNYANDTPAPYPDTPPAPGSMDMALGIERDDRARGRLPIFHWTFTNFMNSVGDMNGRLAVALLLS